MAEIKYEAYMDWDGTEQIRRVWPTTQSEWIKLASVQEDRIKELELRVEAKDLERATFINHIKNLREELEKCQHLTK